MRFFCPWLLASLLVCPSMRGALNGDSLVGDWIWTDGTQDRQECLFVRVIELPSDGDDLITCVRCSPRGSTCGK